MPPKLTRLEFLDSIRGLAALTVLLFHSYYILPHAQWVASFVALPLVSAIFDGPSAVLMFFVLSGFLLSRSYFTLDGKSDPARSIHVPTFYLRRFTRIWLPWLFVFCLTILARETIFRRWTTYPHQTAWFLKFWNSPLTLDNILQQCLFIPQAVGVQVLPQDWSLRLELQASALLPLILLLCRFFTVWALPVLSILTFVFEPTGCYFAFILGIALAKHGEYFRAILLPKPLSVKVSLLILGITLYNGPQIIGYLESRFWQAMISGLPLGKFLILSEFGCVLILLSSMCSRRIQDTLHLPPIIFLGRISYSVYLLQIVVLFCFTPALIHWLNTLGIHRERALFFANLLFSAGLTIALASLNYYWIEKPCIDLGHWLSKRARSRTMHGPSRI